MREAEREDRRTERERGGREGQRERDGKERTYEMNLDTICNFMILPSSDIVRIF